MSESFFLDVSQSFLGRPWQARLSEAASREALVMTQAHGLSDVLGRVLAGRGIAAIESAGFLEPRLRDLMPDPSSLREMDKAAERLAKAVKAREHVAIFGDYDVDGACSSAILADFLTHFGTKVRVHIPDRIFEGYGPNSDAIRVLAGEGATLLVCVDCGTASHEPLAEAHRLGMDVIVLDHHQAPEKLPEVLALVNPNRQDDLSGLGTLCAAGVVFMATVATQRVLRSIGAPEADLMAALDLVALATVADVVPLLGLNRAFVTQGLKVMRGRGRPGIAALCDIARLDRPIEAWHLGFMLGPRINAGGRIGDAGLGVRLLCTRDEAEARAIAETLNQLNRERQVVEQEMLAEAEAQALAAIGIDEAKGAVILTADARWHPGVVGLVASRLKERFRRPAFAIALDEAGRGTGSGRSVAGVDLGKAVRAAVEAGLLVKGGGHAMAAGLTVEASRLEELRDYFEKSLASDVSQSRLDDGLKIDAALTPASVTADLMNEIERAGPFGQGNSEPVFAFPALRLNDATEVGQGHLKMRLTGGDGTRLTAVAFRVGGTLLGQSLVKSRGETIHIAGSLSKNQWGGRETIEIRLIDAAPYQPRRG